jgi:hypothetical protein
VRTQNHLIYVLWFSIADFSKLFDVLKATPLARLGYHQYTAIDNVFDLDMPFMPDDHMSGNVLAGAVVDAEPEAENKLEKTRSRCFTGSDQRVLEWCLNGDDDFPYAPHSNSS